MPLKIVSMMSITTDTFKRDNAETYPTLSRLRFSAIAAF
ncbi:hypothetical protein QOZ95_003727 [Paenibacillus brasilensis]|uniref:Uncharacterized protein n=1 Tax=Paenibacillus brasilensis TaxID=128574 RepID=A0ABU0L1I4_9BACL|nr:hypothetical protein [Paenibacillus brasilensis]